MGDNETHGVGAGAGGTVSVVGGYQWGRPVVGGSAGSEVFLGDLPGGTDLSLLFRGETVSSETSVRDVYIRVDQRYFVLRGGRIPFLGGNIRSLDGAEILFKPTSKLKVGGFFGERNERFLTSDGTLDHRYNGTAYGLSLLGSAAGFDGRVFYQEIVDGDATLREDIGGNFNWRIDPGLSVFVKFAGSLLLDEMMEGRGGLRWKIGPAALTGRFDWADPSLLTFDADDPFLVFNSEPFWRGGGNLSVPLRGGAVLFDVGATHGSTIDYGFNARAQIGRRDFIRLDASYVNDGTVAGNEDNLSAWLTANLDTRRIDALASLGYVQSEGGFLPLYDSGEAVGFLLTADVPISDSLSLGGRFDGTFSENSRYSSLLFLRWSPGVSGSSPPMGRNRGSWEAATVNPPGSLATSDGVSWIVFPVQVVEFEGEGAKDFSHKSHMDLSLSCIDCHDQVPKSLFSSDNLAVVNCANCHEEGRAVKVSIKPPRLNFPHETHVTENKIPCERCHPGVENAGLATRENLPSMTVCTSCHVTWKNECAKCHPAGASGRMQSVFSEGRLRPDESLGEFNHTFGFMRSGDHRSVAPLQMDYCLNCHSVEFSSPGEPKGCQECHDPASLSTSKRHPAGWLASHPQEARHDSLSCRTCHEQSFCQNCHADQNLASGWNVVSPRSYHSEGWVTVDGGDHRRRAAAGVFTCASCHEVETCKKCHTD